MAVRASAHKPHRIASGKFRVGKGLRLSMGLERLQRRNDQRVTLVEELLERIEPVCWKLRNQMTFPKSAVSCRIHVSNGVAFFERFSESVNNSRFERTLYLDK
jgi:hypothetical protein